MSDTGNKQKNRNWPDKPDSLEGHWAPDIHGWFQEYIKPIYDALWHGDSNQACNELDLARSAINEGIVEGETAACMDAQLAYAGYQLEQMVLRSNPKGLNGQQINSKLAQIIQATLIPKKDSQGRESYQYQIRLYILACCSTNFKPLLLDESGYNSWQEKLEPKYQNTEFWNYVACWAYSEDYLPPLEQAYNYMILQGAGFLSEFVFIRTELMLKLRRKLATEEDFLDLMKLTTVSNQLKVVKAIFIDQADKQGIWTPEVDRFYEDLLLELSHNKTSRANRLIDKGEQRK